MVFKHRNSALKELRRYTDERREKIEDEEFSPAEYWLLDKLDEIDFIKTRVKDYPNHKRLKGIGKALGLYPIPDWYRVRQEVLGVERVLPWHNHGFSTKQERQVAKALSFGYLYGASKPFGQS